MYGEHGLKNEFRDYSNKKHMNNEILLMPLHITPLFIPLLVPFFLGSKIIANGDCSHEIKIRLLLRRKAMTNLDNILKSRDITLPPKFPPVKVMIFPALMYRCENWTIKKAER